MGWDYIDVILFTGDAYIDHPAFGAAVIGRLLEAEGYRVAIVPQPNWRDDLRDRCIRIRKKFCTASKCAAVSVPTKIFRLSRRNWSTCFRPDATQLLQKICRIARSYLYRRNFRM